jgi:hypothetical protein
VVDDHREVLARVPAGGAERLGQRLAGVVEVLLVAQDHGLAHGPERGRLVDERGADDVLVPDGGPLGR